LTYAYERFNGAININSTCHASLYIYPNGDTYNYWGANEPRYYDESLETLDAYLMFYDLGIVEALDEATDCWEWVNSHTWDATNNHYNYYPSLSNSYECESGGFLQVALKYQYYMGGEIGNISRITTDMVNRYLLSSSWLSPQWCAAFLSNPKYAVTHLGNGGNTQRRTENTLMAWASIYGNYWNLTEGNRTIVRNMLIGYDGKPAWKHLFQDSGLYNTTVGMFHEFSDQTHPRNYATADMATLLIFLGIVPENATLALPISEMIYEDVGNLRDYDLFNLNIPSRKLRISIMKPGYTTFIYGTANVSYNFLQKGVYDLTFASDWNSITNGTKVGNLPSNRKYFTESFGYSYTFSGLLSEVDGSYLGAVNVTAYFTDEDFTPETFEVDESTLYSSMAIPQYFIVSTTNREYWVSDGETGTTIKLYNETFTTYTILFSDFAGALNDHPFVKAKHYINGILETVEKRKVDAEDKVQFLLREGEKYTITVEDGASYSYGDILFTTTTTISLTLKGIDFPQDILLSYQYVRIYGTRTFATPNGTIVVNYVDTLGKTNNVVITIMYNNGTVAYTTTVSGSSTFSDTWSSAMNNTDYRLSCTITHDQFGVMGWKQYLPRTFSEAPFPLAWLGTWGFDSSQLIPALLIVFVFGCFSVLNAYIGAFFGTVTATILAYIGWISIPSTMIVTAFAFCVLLGITVAKRRGYF
jgi:hypothetical protein